MPSAPAASSVDAEDAKRDRFERLKEQYRQQLRAARLQESTPTASPATGVTPTRKPAAAAHKTEEPVRRGPRKEAPPALVRPLAHTLSAPPPDDGSSADEAGSSISVSPLTTPGASYSTRTRQSPPPTPAMDVRGARKPKATAATTNKHAVPASAAADPSRPSFATDFANVYGPDATTEDTLTPVPTLTSTKRTRRPSADTRGTGAAAASTTPTRSGSRNGSRNGLQLRMTQRPASASSVKSPTSPPVAETTRAKKNSPPPSSITPKAARTASPKAGAPRSGKVVATAKTHACRGVSEQGLQMEQMEAVMDYLESVTQALAQRTKSLPPPDSLVAFRASITPATRQATTTPTAPTAEAHFSLLSELQETSSALLSWFSKLEYPRLPSDTTLEEVEQHTLRTCRELVALVEKIDRKFSTHEFALVREGYAERQRAVTAHRQLVDAVARTAQHVVVLRRLVQERDLHQVRAVLAVHQTELTTTAQTAVCPAQVEAMLAGPYFDWLDQRWLPAMRQWKRITHTALQEARHTGQYKAAISKAQRESLSVLHLHDILRPGETMTDVLRVEVGEPIEAMASDGVELQAAVGDLEAAMVAPRLATLAKAIRRVQACLGEVGSLSSAETSPARRAEERLGASASATTTMTAPPLSPLSDSGAPSLSEAAASASATTANMAEHAIVKRAQQLLVQVQQAESSLRAMRMAVQVPGSALSLFHVLHKANELLYLLALGVEPLRVQTVVRLCRPIAQVARESRSRRSSIAAAVVESDRNTAAGEKGPSPWSSPSRASPSPAPRGPSMESATSTSAAPRLVELLTARGLGVEDVCLAHSPSNVWTEDCTETYQALCEALVKAYGREAAQLGLEQAMQTQVARADTADGDDASAASDTASAARDRVMSCEELRTRLQYAESLGLTGPLLEAARERLRQWQSLRLKVHFQAQTRLIQLIDPTTSHFSEVYEQLYAFCVEQAVLSRASAVIPGQELRIRYEDVDGDYISIVNDADWALMLSEIVPAAATSSAMVGRKVDLFCDFPVLPSADPAVVKHHDAQQRQTAAAVSGRPAAPVEATAERGRAPGMTRSAALRLAAARSRSAGGPTVSRGSAAFAQRSRSGPGRAARDARRAADPVAASEDAPPRAARRAGPRRVMAAVVSDDAESAHPPPPPAAAARGTVHRNILNGAKRWDELGPDAAASAETLELMTTATTTTTASATRAAPAAQTRLRTPSLSAAALALPPRPQPVSHPQRTTTPHRRLSRRGSQSDLNTPGNAETNRSTEDLMAEMSRLQEENELAMHKRTTPRAS